jgi:hypothetical protein
VPDEKQQEKEESVLTDHEVNLDDYLLVRCPDMMSVICRKHEKLIPALAPRLSACCHPSRSNRCRDPFLFPITKSDVRNKLEKVWAKGLGRVAKTQILKFAPPVSMLCPPRLSPDTRPIMPK